MKHESDYADYEDGCTAGDCVIFQARPHHPPYREMTHRRLDVRTYPERAETEIEELRRRVAALEALARWQYDQ